MTRRAGGLLFQPVDAFPVEPPRIVKIKRDKYVYVTKVCSECRVTFKPTGAGQMACSPCGPIRKKRLDQQRYLETGKKRRKPLSVDEATRKRARRCPTARRAAA
jgi:tRNA(Ile2) C34 agmatinyltransferase TiaS